MHPMVECVIILKSRKKRSERVKFIKKIITSITHKLLKSIHSLIFSTADPVQGHGRAGAYFSAIIEQQAGYTLESSSSTAGAINGSNVSQK